MKEELLEVILSKLQQNPKKFSLTKKDAYGSWECILLQPLDKTLSSLDRSHDIWIGRTTTAPYAYYCQNEVLGYKSSKSEESVMSRLYKYCEDKLKTERETLEENKRQEMENYFINL